MSKVEGKKLGDILNLKRGYDLPSYEREDGLYLRSCTILKRGCKKTRDAKKRA